MTRISRPRRLCVPHRAATRLLTERRRLGLTQAQVASTLGCTRGYIDQLEQSVRVPTLDQTLKIARALAVDPRSLSPYLADSQ